MVWPQYHEHHVLSGESKGLILGHSHGFYDEGHTHREHCYPLRADGGFWADYGPANAHRPVELVIDGKQYSLPASTRSALVDLLRPYLRVARRL